MDIPVYLFTGFLESGKTKFIQETLTDKRFHNGEKTLLLLCEEGIEEYDTSAFSGGNVFIETVDKEQLTENYLETLRKKFKAERVIIEYNGMWPMNDLFQNLPKKWIIGQEFMFADANTFVSYNANMRSLVVEKLTTAELVVFNRYNDAVNKMDLHKIVRGVNRRVNIAYERISGDVQYDDIEDPLPFDIEAPSIDIRDEDYALWYRDLSEELAKYNGKKIKFKALVAKHHTLPADTLVVGRQLMTCCIEDIQFAGIICKTDKADTVSNKQWVVVNGELRIENNKLYGNIGPVLYAEEILITTEPNEPVATFY